MEKVVEAINKYCGQEVTLTIRESDLPREYSVVSGKILQAALKTATGKWEIS